MSSDLRDTKLTWQYTSSALLRHTACRMAAFSVLPKGMGGNCDARHRVFVDGNLWRDLSLKRTLPALRLRLRSAATIESYNRPAHGLLQTLGTPGCRVRQERSASNLRLPVATVDDAHTLARGSPMPSPVYPQSAPAVSETVFAGVRGYRRAL